MNEYAAHTRLAVMTLHEAIEATMQATKSPGERRLLTGLNDGDANLVQPTSFNSFDYIAGGLPIGGMTIVGGRPGSAKSAFAKSMLIRFAKKGIAVGLITLDEDHAKVAVNALAHESAVQNWCIERGQLTQPQREELARAARAAQHLPFYISDQCRSLADVVSTVRHLHEDYGCKVFAIDNVHLVKHEMNESATRNDEITEISGTLKWVFKTLRVTGIVVANLNRAGEGIACIPTLNNLRDSGSLEADGDLIVLTHRRDLYRNNPATTDGQELDQIIELNVVKNKAGGTGTAVAYWNGHHQAVEDWEGNHSRSIPGQNEVP